ncbi:helix-turn-helix domain-containing protein [Endothiovibrio diazotrophicus]
MELTTEHMGGRIRIERMLRGYSLDELAELVHTTYSKLLIWEEHAIHGMTAENLAWLEACLQRKAEWLVTGHISAGNDTPASDPMVALVSYFEGLDRCSQRATLDFLRRNYLPDDDGLDR